MASTEESRKSFANSVLRFLVYYGFDGLDMDWEYPTARGGIAADAENYVALLKVIKEAISPWGLTLTTAVPIDDALLGTAYDASAMAEIVDYVHLMAYDYVPSTSKVTGLSAPLSAIKNTVSNWINAGLPAKKMILGIPSYGRNYVLENENKHDIGDPVLNAGLPGDYTSEDGFLAYYEVMQIVNDQFLFMESVEIDGTNYAYGSGEWITYETEATVRTKAQYAIDEGLGGIMMWSVDTDDFQGLYGKKFPLLSAINDVIKKT
uniref:Chitotriosidase n=2 Tax=Anoplophora glabripennis TaxID=217634 RepID=V5GVS8_ANOGL